MMRHYKLIDTDSNTVIAEGVTEAAVLAYTPYLPADCVPGAATWDEVVDVAQQHADGLLGVVDGYRVEAFDHPAHYSQREEV